MGEGRHLSGKLLWVTLTKANDTQYGITVAKKLVRRAVDRNHIKRRIREAVRHLSLQGVHVVIGAKQNALGASTADIQTDLTRILSWLKTT